MNFNDTEEEYPETICKLDGFKIKNVRVFKYLGANIQYRETSTGDTEINQRIDSAEARYYEHAKKLMNFRISIKTRVLILNALVRSRLAYGCQVWTLTVEQRRRINSFYCGLLRRMIRGGFNRKDNSMAFKLSNETLLDMCNTESIEMFVARQQRQYLAHIIRREDESLVKKLTFNDDEAHVPGPCTTLRSSVMKREVIHEHDFYRRCIMNLI